MSRLPPMLEQLINGKIVKGANLLPVESNGIVYSIYTKTIPNEQGRLYKQEISLEAKKINGEILWKTVLYTKIFNEMLETDVQVRYPVDICFDNNNINVIVKFEHYSDIEGIYSCNKETGKLN